MHSVGRKEERKRGKKKRKEKEEKFENTIHDLLQQFKSLFGTQSIPKQQNLMGDLSGWIR